MGIAIGDARGLDLARFDEAIAEVQHEALEREWSEVVLPADPLPAVRGREAQVRRQVWVLAIQGTVDAGVESQQERVEPLAVGRAVLWIGVVGRPAIEVVELGKAVGGAVEQRVALGHEIGIARHPAGGERWNLVGGGFTDTLYSLRVDPADPRHLLSGLHEQDGLVESTDGGESWHRVDKAGWPSGGASWFPFFIDDASAPAGKTWFAIAQGGSAVMTRDGGAHWTIPTGIEGLEHGHGCAQIAQRGTTLIAAGIYGPGQGVYRSTNTGATWARIDNGQPQSVVWATDKAIDSMWGWACSDCAFDDFETAPWPGTVWTKVPVPQGIGATNVVVTGDGGHAIFVGVMWAAGIWRYIEP